MQRLQRQHVELTEYEAVVAADVADPEDLTVSWADVGGLTQTVDVLKEAVVLPFKHPDLFTASRYHSSACHPIALSPLMQAAAGAQGNPALRWAIPRHACTVQDRHHVQVRPGAARRCWHVP